MLEASIVQNGLDSTEATDLFYNFKNQKFGTEHQTRYVHYSPSEPSSSKEQLSIICIHGFGGNADQFRKNLPFLSDHFRADCYAIDLLGYGYSDKPDPREPRWGGVNQLYNFELWAEQVSAFVQEVVKAKDEQQGITRKIFLVCNSVGGVLVLLLAIPSTACSLPDILRTGGGTANGGDELRRR